jgi:hypothetical protein
MMMDKQLGRLLYPDNKAPLPYIPGRKVQRFPFVIKIAKTPAELQKAVEVRRSAYGRHLPELAAKMDVPDALDLHPDVSVLLVESKLDGEALGTARIQVNYTSPLCVEQAVTLPLWMKGQRLAEVTRLGVVSGRSGMLAKLALWKACFFFWEATQVQWAIAAGRAPLDQQYLDLAFKDLFPDLGYIPLGYAGDVPHRIMAFEIPTAYRRWKESSHRLFDFIFLTDHPDIQLSDAALRQIPRQASSPLPNWKTQLG